MTTRTAVVLGVIAGSLAGSSSALGGHWFINRHGAVAHIHARNQPVFREFTQAGEDNGMRRSFDYARGEWYDTTIADLPVTSSHGSALIHAIDTHNSQSIYAGVAAVGDGHPGWSLSINSTSLYSIYNNSDTGGHYRHGHVLLNRAILANRSDGVKQAVACHELGHILGMQHETAQTSCMNDPTSYPHPSQHDRDHVNYLFGSFH